MPPNSNSRAEIAFFAASILCVAKPVDQFPLAPLQRDLVGKVLKHLAERAAGDFGYERKITERPSKEVISKRLGVALFAFLLWICLAAVAQDPGTQQPAGTGQSAHDLYDKKERCETAAP